MQLQFLAAVVYRNTCAYHTLRRYLLFVWRLLPTPNRKYRGLPIIRSFQHLWVVFIPTCLLHFRLQVACPIRGHTLRHGDLLSSRTLRGQFCDYKDIFLFDLVSEKSFHALPSSTWSQISSHLDQERPQLCRNKVRENCLNILDDSTLMTFRQILPSPVSVT